MKTRIVITFISAIILLSGCMFSSASVTSNKYEKDIERFYPFFKDNSISKVICYGGYVAYLDELLVSSKVVYTDEGKIYTTKPFLESSELYKIEKNATQLVVYISSEASKKDEKMVQASLYGCVNAVVNRYKIDKYNELLENPLMKKLYAGERNNDSNLTYQEFMELETNSVGEVEINSTTTAKYINEVINLDTAAAIDVRDSFNNLQKIVSHLDRLKRRDLDKFVIAELGVEYNEKVLYELGIDLRVINKILNETPSIDSAGELQGFINSLVKLNRGANSNLYILKYSDYSYLGLSFDEKYTSGINEALRLSKAASKVKNNPAYIKQVISSLEAANRGELKYKDFRVLGLYYPNNFQRDGFLEAVNRILKIREVNDPESIQKTIDAVDKLNKVDRRSRRDSLSIVEYNALGVDTGAVNKDELDKFVNDPYPSLVNRPEKVYEYSLLLNRLFLGSVTKEDLSILGLSQHNNNLDCINYSLALRKNEKLRKEEIKEVAEAVDRLKNQNRLTRKELNTLGMKNGEGNNFVKKDAITQTFFNNWIERQEFKHCVKELHEFIKAYYKLQRQERINRKLLKPNDYVALGLKFDESIKHEFTNALNEVVINDNTNVLQIETELDSLYEIYKILSSLNKNFSLSKLEKVGVVSSSRIDENDLKMVFNLRNAVEYSPIKLSEILKKIDGFNRASQRENLNYSREDYQLLGLSLKSQNEADGINELCNVGKNIQFSEIKEYRKIINKLYLGQLSLSNLKKIDKNFRFSEKNILEANEIFKKKSSFSFKLYLEVLSVLQKITLINNSKKSWTISTDELFLVDLTNKKNQVENSNAKRLLNEYILKNKKKLKQEDINLVIELFYQEKCTKSHLKIAQLNSFKTLDTQNFCREFLKRDLEKDDYKSLNNFINSLENIVSNNTQITDPKNLNISLEIDENNLINVIQDLNERLKNIFSNSEKIALAKDVFLDRDSGGIIIPPITKKLLLNYKIEINEEKITQNLLKLATEIVENFKKPIRKNRLQQVIDASINVVNTSNGMGSLTTGDIVALGLVNSDGSDITKEQLSLISEYIRVGAKSQLFLSLKKGVIDSFNKLQ